MEFPLQLLLIGYLSRPHCVGLRYQIIFSVSTSHILHDIKKIKPHIPKGVLFNVKARLGRCNGC